MTFRWLFALLPSLVATTVTGAQDEVVQARPVSQSPDRRVQALFQTMGEGSYQSALLPQLSSENVPTLLELGASTQGL